MNDSDSRSNAASSTDALGAILSDGLMAGLIGGIVGSILPIFGLFARNSSMVSLGFFVSFLLYFAIGILTGYLFYSRKIGYRWGAATAAIIAGLIAGLMIGAALGFGFAQFPYFGVQNTSWAIWSLSSGMGGGFMAALTAWIPGLFMKSDNARAGQPAAASKTESFFERRMKTRFIVGMVSIVVFIVIFVCRALVQ
jgi:hypothetical protein